jgi:hypothetical protein
MEGVLFTFLCFSECHDSLWIQNLTLSQHFPVRKGTKVDYPSSRVYTSLGAWSHYLINFFFAHRYPADLFTRAKVESILDWHHSNLRRGAGEKPDLTQRWRVQLGYYCSSCRVDFSVQDYAHISSLEFCNNNSNELSINAMRKRWKSKGKTIAVCRTY